MDGFDPQHICNHSDHQGRYAFARQPAIAYWNLMCLGQALLPLIGDSDRALAAIDRFKTAYPACFEAAMAKKLGFGTPPAADALRQNLNAVLGLMAQEQTDYTVFWRALGTYARTGERNAVLDQVVNREGFDAWLLSFEELHAQYGQGPDADLMHKANPKYVLRNHLAQQAIEKAETGDFRLLNDLLAVLAAPYDEHPGFEAWAAPAPEWARSLQLSCSS